MSSILVSLKFSPNSICIAQALAERDDRPEDDPEHPWCLTESQDWVGSDIVRADCNVNPSDPTCGGNSSDISAASMRLANLYNDTIVSARSLFRDALINNTSLALR